MPDEPMNARVEPSRTGMVPETHWWGVCGCLAGRPLCGGARKTLAVERSRG